jgi:outer membrane scaffolding protein for murein synthesis (MipA/OmpV family)
MACGRFGGLTTMHFFPFFYCVFNRRAKHVLGFAAVSVVWSALAPMAVAANTSRWSGSIGPAGIVMPTYEGSDRYKVMPGLVGNITYDDMISLGTQGLSLYWHHNALRIGGGVTYRGERKDDSSNSLFAEGDKRLAGMGSIRAAVGVRGFASYDLGRLNLSASVTKFEGSDNNGLTVDFGAYMPFRLTQSLTVTPHVGMAWANKSYMQTFFGVTPTQSAATKFAVFAPSSTFKNVGGGVSINYALSEHWFIAEIVDAKALLGDASHSPLTYSKAAVTSATMLGYRF